VPGNRSSPARLTSGRPSSTLKSGPALSLLHTDSTLDDWDDPAKEFLVIFSEAAPEAQEPRSQASAFQLRDDQLSGKRGTTLTRPNQQRFRCQVLKQYGPKCAVCSVSRVDLLVAAYICPRSARVGERSYGRVEFRAAVCRTGSPEGPDLARDGSTCVGGDRSACKGKLVAVRRSSPALLLR